MLRHFNSGGSPDSRAGEVLDFFHGVRKALAGRLKLKTQVLVKREIKRW